MPCVLEKRDLATKGPASIGLLLTSCARVATSLEATAPEESPSMERSMWRLAYLWFQS